MAAAWTRLQPHLQQTHVDHVLTLHSLQQIDPSLNHPCAEFFKNLTSSVFLDHICAELFVRRSSVKCKHIVKQAMQALEFFLHGLGLAMTHSSYTFIFHFTSCCHFAVCTVKPVVSYQTFWLRRRHKQFCGTEPGYVLQPHKSALREMRYHASVKYSTDIPLSEAVWLSAGRAPL